MEQTSALFFLQCAERFHSAERITFKVGSSLPGSTASPAGVSCRALEDTAMAASINTDTTLDSDSTSFEDLSAFQARLRKRWAVAFLKFSHPEVSNCPTMVSTKPGKEQR